MLHFKRKSVNFCIKKTNYSSSKDTTKMLFVSNSGSQFWCLFCLISLYFVTSRRRSLKFFQPVLLYFSFFFFYSIPWCITDRFEINRPWNRYNSIVLGRKKKKFGFKRVLVGEFILGRCSTGGSDNCGCIWTHCCGRTFFGYANYLRVHILIPDVYKSYTTGARKNVNPQLSAPL